MTESMIVEAIRSAHIAGPEALQMVQPVAQTPDPEAVARFQAAMDVQAPTATREIPFADSVAQTWTRAHENNQGIVHRIRALTELSSERALSAPELYELQYEVANLAFQQEVVAKVADKASTAVQTLIKNQ